MTRPTLTQLFRKFHHPAAVYDRAEVKFDTGEIILCEFEMCIPDEPELWSAFIRRFWHHTVSPPSTSSTLRVHAAGSTRAAALRKLRRELRGHEALFGLRREPRPRKPSTRARRRAR